MGQKSFINYKEEILSFPLAEKNMGILKSGRYSGFDTMASVSALIIQIGHSNAIKKTLDDNSQVTSFGSYLTPTGTIIHEEDTKDLTIANNTGNANTRIDWIVSEHTYTAIQGGSVATYTVIQGPNDGNEPVLTDDKIQTLLCKVLIAPEGTVYGDLTLEILSPPTLGNTTAQQAYNLIKVLVNAGLPVSTDAIKGIIELATNAEALAGTDTDRAITAATLAYVITNSNIVVDATYVATANDFTDGLLTKLNGIDTGAQVNVQTDWDAISGDQLLLNKPNVVDVLLQGKTTQAVNLDGTGDGAITNVGFTSVVYDGTGDTGVWTFTFPSVGTDQYHPLVSYYTTGAVLSNNETGGAVVRNKTSTSFEWLVRETGGDTESVLVLVTLIAHV